MQAFKLTTLSSAMALALYGTYVTADDSLSKTPSESIEETMIVGEETVQEDSLSGFEVNLLDTEEFMNSNASINDIMATTPGIIIRETGGLGSSFELALNGLKANQIRYFFDGIPMEGFGSALTLNNFPVNLTQQVEIYKGVVPITLGADALGGAINIKTPSLDEDVTDLSYTYGSFNTHKVAVFAQRGFDSGFFWRLTSFANHSDNNYEMDDIPIQDQFGNHTGMTTSHERFNDKYQSGMLSLKSGVIDKSYADELSFKLTYAANYDEEQHPDKTTTKVFGGMYKTNDTKLASVIYKKQFDALNIKGYFLKGQIKEVYNDKEQRTYDWDGSWKESGNAEWNPRRRIFVLTDDILRGNISAEFDVTTEHRLSLNLTTDTIKRQGNDRLQIDDITPFTDPSTVSKHILGTAYRYTHPSDAFSATTFVKQYFYNADIEVSSGTIRGEERFDDKITDELTGYGLTARMDLGENTQIKTSYERAYRLPEYYEMLGDGRFLEENPELKSETSDNINLGINWEDNFDFTSLNLSMNLFYRDVSNYIKQYPIPPIKTKYSNIGKVNVQGIESALATRLLDSISFSFNVTYQDIINKTRVTPDGKEDPHNGDRITNEPYLFANANAGYDYDINSNHQLRFNYRTQYVHEFFLLWESKGEKETKNTIDTQLTHDIDISYIANQGMYNLTFSVSNLTDEKVYDHFSIQKPGRAYYLKLRYAL